MKYLQHISLFLLAGIFLITSSGIVIFKTNCSCTGNEKISLYVTPEDCTAEFHKSHIHCTIHEEHKNENDCESCEIHKHDCGCEDPEIKYVKLKNHITNGHIEFLKSLPVKQVAVFDFCFILFEKKWIEDETLDYYIDPPPEFHSSNDYLIRIQKLKIPLSA